MVGRFYEDQIFYDHCLIENVQEIWPTVISNNGLCIHKVLTKEVTKTVSLCRTFAHALDPNMLIRTLSY